MIYNERGRVEKKHICIKTYLQKEASSIYSHRLTKTQRALHAKDRTGYIRRRRVECYASFATIFSTTSSLPLRGTHRLPCQVLRKPRLSSTHALLPVRKEKQKEEVVGSL